MPIAFRPFASEQDFDVLARLWSLDNPDWPMCGHELIQKESQRSPEFVVDRWIGEIDGNPVCGYCYGDQFWAHQSGRKHLAFFVDPPFSSEALPAVFDRAEEHMKQDGTNELNFWSRDDHPDTLAEFERRGGAFVERQPVSRLTLSEFDESQFSTDLSSHGLRIASMSELDAEGFDWIPEHHEATWEMVQDIPSAQAPTRIELGQFRIWMENRELYERDLMFAVLDKTRIAGYTRLISSEVDHGLLFTGLTGVRKEYRRKGVATAVKVHSILKMRDRGVHTIQTDNLDTNPMLGLNVRLGFKSHFAWLHYMKKV